MDIAQLSADYDRDGYLRIHRFLPAELLADVRGRLEKYQRDVVPSVPEGDRTFEADGKTIRNLWRMEQHDPFFAELGKREEIVALVSALVRGKAELRGVETFNKPAKVGSGVPPHQDNAYFCQSPADILTVWVAMDAATVENGPIYYLKGSHKLGVLPHRASGVKGNSYGLAAMPAHEKADEFCGTLEPGDALIHHSQTVHWSAPNKSDQPRCGLLMVYRGMHTRDVPEMKAAYEAALAKVK
jgi:ectoine hydroxylase-related dioxygenase (phytanoyl-CoA dioxygenase family)